MAINIGYGDTDGILLQRLDISPVAPTVMHYLASVLYGNHNRVWGVMRIRVKNVSWTSLGGVKHGRF